MRKHFLDNMRWSVVLAVLVYHVFYNFNAEGVFGGLGSFAEVQYQDSIMYVLYPWFMILLFLVSGVCSRYALASKGPRAFVRSRTVKLLVPSTVGLFVFQWILGYFNTRIAGAWDSIPSFARYPVMVLSGVGPLWFIQLLWLYSLLAAVIYQIIPERIFPGQIFQEKDSQAAGSVTSAATSASGPAPASGLSRKLAVGLALLVGGFLLLWGAAQSQIDSPSTAQGLLNLYRPAFYIVPFLLGYFIFSDERVQDLLAGFSLPLLVAAIAGAVLYTLHYFGADYTSPACLQSVWTNLYAWVATLAMFGCYKRWADRTSPVADYLTRSSFGLYIVHMAVCTGLCFLLKDTGLPVWSIYCLALAGTAAGSVFLYELLRRIPVLRWCVFGIK